jgi:hypothetical protein
MTTELFVDKEISKTDEALHDECIFLMEKIKYQMYRVTYCFNRVIELNQKILILSKCLTFPSFTEGLITSLPITDREASDFNKRSTTSVLPSHAAK